MGLAAHDPGGQLLDDGVPRLRFELGDDVQIPLTTRTFIAPRAPGPERAAAPLPRLSRPVLAQVPLAQRPLLVSSQAL